MLLEFGQDGLSLLTGEGQGGQLVQTLHHSPCTHSSDAVLRQTHRELAQPPYLQVVRIVWAKLKTTATTANMEMTNIFIQPYYLLIYSRLCPSTAGSSSSSVFQLSLSFAVFGPVAPQCHFSNDVLAFKLTLRPLTSTLCGPSSIIHSGNVSSPIPFSIGYVLSYVCHSCSLPVNTQTYKRQCQERLELSY